MDNFDQIQVGDKAELKHLITKSDIDKFVDLTGDDNKLHIDGEYARHTSFKKPVVHGMLGASFISTVIGTKLPGDGALWFSQSLDFLLPVRIGDEITIKAEVIKKIENDRILEIRTDILNSDKQKVTTGVAKVKVIKQDVDEENITADNLVTKEVALVIGGSGGIGEATCIELAKAGFNVAVHHNSNNEKAKQIKEKIEKIGKDALVVKADITDEIQVKEMLASVMRKFGRVSVVINCATYKIPVIKIDDLEWKDIQRHIDINIKGNFFLVKNIISIMEGQKYGKIINILTQAIEAPNPGWLHYITAKSALNGFSKALAVELAQKGILVNMVSPGMTETDLIFNIPEKTKLIVAAKAPLKRLARPIDIAHAIVFLASKKSNYLLGETIRINGGQVML